MRRRDHPGRQGRSSIRTWALISFSFDPNRRSDVLTVAGCDLTVNFLYLVRGIVKMGTNRLLH